MNVGQHGLVSHGVLSAKASRPKFGRPPAVPAGASKGAYGVHVISVLLDVGCVDKAGF